MQLSGDGFLHLCYCTNIHPGDNWAAVDANVRKFGPALRARLGGGKKFGLGLRLSARDASELLEGDRLERFRSFLEAEGLYVALINGFPYGPFHKTVVKADVYAPDWREKARVRYTIDLAKILGRLLPEGLDGGVSTAPLSYKAWLPAPSPAEWELLARNVARVAEALVRIHRESGQWIHLDIEPEPDCLIETSQEVLDFFAQWLLPLGGAYLAKQLGVGLAAAQDHLRDHVQVCFDCCHFAVEYEDPVVALERITSAGIKIGRVQLSSALKVVSPGGVAERLRPFADSTYLHQVVESRGGCLLHFPDLDQALLSAPSADTEEWRIHFHVPLFATGYDGFGSTQSYVQTVLKAAWAKRFTRHLEIETYTWDVLPPELKVDLLDSIGREYEWVLAQLPHE